MAVRIPTVVGLLLVALLLLGYCSPSYGTTLFDMPSKRHHYTVCTTKPTVVLHNKATPKKVILSIEQVQLLRSAWHTASSVQSSKGTKWAYTIASIALRESSAGKCRVGDIHLPHAVRCDPGMSAAVLLDTALSHPEWRDASYGPYQMQIRTVRQVARVAGLRYTAQLSDEDIVHLLLTDQEYALRLALLYLDWLEDTSRTYFQVVSRYNGGWNNRVYYTKIQQDMSTVRELERMGCFD